MLRFVLAPTICSLVLLAQAGPYVGIAGSAASDLLGDADCSGSVNPIDSLTILRADGGIAAAPCVELADVQCDGDVDPVDSLQLLRWDAGLSVNQEAGCDAIGAGVGPPATSEALIAQALADGDITYEESLLYRAYALYDHPDLPEEFRSPIPDIHAGLALFLEVAQNEPQLTQGLLDQLAPFSARPADPISILNNPSNGVAASVAAAWKSLPAGGGAARVWLPDSPGVDLRLTNYAAAVTKVWNALPGIFRYGIPDTPGAANINPDGAIDIYFVDPGSIDPRIQGCDTAVPTPPECAMAANGQTRHALPNFGRVWSAYVLISTARQGDALINTLAHELGHVGQFAYDAYEPMWLMDSTATWTAFRVVQQVTDASQTYTYDRLPAFFKGLQKPLTRDTEDDLNRYGSWLFFFFASMEKGDQIVTKVWEQAAADGAQNEHAVDMVFPFDSYFDNFSLQNWNEKPPLLDVYKDAEDTFPAHKPDRDDITLAPPDDAVIEEELEPLSAHYYAYTFGAPVHSVIFHNKLDGKPHARFWGIAKVNGEWQEPEDWTGVAEKGWCRDVPDQHLEELIVIFSNSGMTGKVTSSESSVEAKASKCSNWRGTVNWTVDEVDGTSHLTQTSVADVYFRNDQPPGTSSCDVQGTFVPCEVYRASGTVTFDSLFVTPFCTVTVGPATGSIAPTDGILIVYTDPDPQPYEGTEMTRVTGPTTTACVGDPVLSGEYDDFDIWFRAPPGMFHVKDEGTAINDTYTFGDITYEWRLEPAP